VPVCRGSQIITTFVLSVFCCTLWQEQVHCNDGLRVAISTVPLYCCLSHVVFVVLVKKTMKAEGHLCALIIEIFIETLDSLDNAFHFDQFTVLLIFLPQFLYYFILYYYACSSHWSTILFFEFTRSFVSTFTETIKVVSMLFLFIL